MPKESRFTEKFGDLGFARARPEFQEFMELTVLAQLRAAGLQGGGHLNRHERRAYVKASGMTFAIVNTGARSITYAVDETGKYWIRQEKIDPAILIDLGFQDISEEAQAAAAKPIFMPSSTTFH